MCVFVLLLLQEAKKNQKGKSTKLLWVAFEDESLVGKNKGLACRAEVEKKNRRLSLSVRPSTAPPPHPPQFATSLWKAHENEEGKMIVHCMMISERRAALVHARTSSSSRCRPSRKVLVGWGFVLRRRQATEVSGPVSLQPCSFHKTR